jgi:hypothetical protein
MRSPETRGNMARLLCGNEPKVDPVSHKRNPEFIDYVQIMEATNCESTMTDKVKKSREISFGI